MKFEKYTEDLVRDAYFHDIDNSVQILGMEQDEIPGHEKYSDLREHPEQIKQFLEGVERFGESLEQNKVDYGALDQITGFEDADFSGVVAGRIYDVSLTSRAVAGLMDYANNNHETEENIDIESILEPVDHIGAEIDYNGFQNDEVKGNEGLMLPFHTIALNFQDYVGMAQDNPEIEVDVFQTDRIDILGDRTGYEIYIADNGTGSEVSRKVFEKGYSDQDSTGFGLYMAREVLNSYGGEIELTPEDSRVSELEGFGLKVALPKDVYGLERTG